MVRLTKIYTRGGDSGETSLTGGDRVSKSSARVRAIGEVDEANSAIGLAIGRAEPGDRKILRRLQNDLFDLGADISTPGDGTDSNEDALRIVPQQVERLEQRIDELNAELKPLDSFVLPGGTEAGARLHLARAIVRRAERTLVQLAEEEPVNPIAMAYLNRLSDLLFVLARRANGYGRADILWVPGENRPDVQD